jgi:hypothetical protein
VATSSHYPFPPPGPGAPGPGEGEDPPTRPELAPRSVAPAVLQVAQVFRGQIIGYLLLDRRGKVTVGPSKRATLVTPPVWRAARRFTLLAPRRNGYVLRLSPAFAGEVHDGSKVLSVADLLARPAARQRARRAGDIREVMLVPGDRAKLTLRESDLRFEIRWVDPAERIPRPRIEDPLLWKTTLASMLVLGAMAVLLLFIWSKEPPRSLALSAERMAKIEAPVIEIEKKASARRAHEREAKEKKKQEEGQMKRARDKVGRIGRADAKPKETVVPKGDKDVLREKVANTGILSALGKDKAPGSGLAKLFADSHDVEQAVAGMAGAKLVAGRGAGGLATSGAGAGGGGTGFGHIYGSGNLDTGGRGRHGHGRGPKLAERGEKEVSVGMGSGGGETDGSLSKEQINKVVRSHLAGVKYCYEKELQRKASLAGGIDIFWVIQPDGNVSKASVKGSTIGDAAVEGCILRQVKQWQFPKAPGQTIVGRYPFIFKGGS